MYSKLLVVGAYKGTFKTGEEITEYYICVDITFKSHSSVAVCPRPLLCQDPGLFKSAYCKPRERRFVFYFFYFRDLLNLPHDVPAVKGGQQDDSDSALLANHVPLHNYPLIYCQDPFLIRSHESELVC